MPRDKLKALLLGRRIVVFDRPRARDLYFNEGFYGKFFMVSKPKTPNVERELELSLLEALYLVEKGRLEVIDGEGRPVSIEELRKLGREAYENFDEVYAVYKDLRDRGLIVKSGMKFGATFVVYRLGPGLEHAPFLVHVLPYDSRLDPLEIVRAGRLSHSVRKRFIIAYVDPLGRVSYLQFRWMM
ncbi:MAG: tRNA-intron lyase [Thermoprotei archaeon]|nr:MAG: tRNA-intron lyase [Thermoprotei archaeon]